MNWIDVVSRWLHVGTAIVLLGGATFMRCVLLPSARQLPDAEHERLRELVLGRWKRFVHGGILLLLLTGFYNYFQALPAEAFRKQYHMLVGIKILLAFAVFGLASVLVGRNQAFDALRRQPARALGGLLLLGFLIVGISGYLKVAGQKALRAANVSSPTVDLGSPAE